MKHWFLFLFIILTLSACKQETSFDVDQRCPDKTDWCELNQQCQTEDNPCQEIIASDPGEAEAIALARDFVKDSDIWQAEVAYNLQLVQAIKNKCSGCWTIEMKFNVVSAEGDLEQVLTMVSLDDWQLKELNTARRIVSEMTAVECEAQGGEIMNIAGGFGCLVNQTEIGRVKDVDFKAVCCY